LRFSAEAGQSQTVTIHVPLRSLQYWSTAEGKWVKATGLSKVRVGGSSRDLLLEASVSIQQSQSNRSRSRIVWLGHRRLLSTTTPATWQSCVGVSTHYTPLKALGLLNVR